MVLYTLRTVDSKDFEFVTVDISLIKIRKNSGARFDPCGPPEQTLIGLEIIIT